MPSQGGVVRTLGLTAGYRAHMPIVKDLSIELPATGVFLVIGPNGAGKSTFLKSLYGLTRVMSGDVLLRGQSISQLAPWRRRQLGLGLVPQGRCNFPYMTVKENLQLGVRLARSSPPREIIDRLVERYPRLAERWKTLAGNLSGGEQQMLETAMVLAGEPDVLLIDEPSLGLAPIWRTQIFRELRALGSEMAIVVVEQNVRSALEACDDVIVMEQGRISFRGSPDSLIDDPRLRAAFLGTRRSHLAESMRLSADSSRATTEEEQAAVRNEHEGES